MKKECYLIGDSENDKSAETEEYTNGVIGLVLRAIQEACRDGADEVSIRFTAEAKRQCCVADVLKALKKSGYRNYEYDNYRNLHVKLRKQGTVKTKINAHCESKRLSATEAKEIADRVNKITEYSDNADRMVEALFGRAREVSEQGEYRFGFVIEHNEPNRDEIIKRIVSSFAEHGYSVKEELDHKTFYVHW